MDIEIAKEKLKYMADFTRNVCVRKDETEAIETVLDELDKNKRLFSIQEKRKLQLLRRKDRELDKKDKIIDYMANFINDNTPYTKDMRVLENERGVRSTKYTKQYFKKKVEDK